MAAVQLCFLGDEQAQKRLADVAKTNDREIIRRDGPLFLNQCAVAAASFAAAGEMSAASSSSTRETTMIPSSASFHFFSSMTSRTAGTVFPPSPVYKPGA